MLEEIDFLINNAAVMAYPFGLDEEGDVLLTELLMPNILKAPNGSRIITVSSSTHDQESCGVEILR